MRPHTLPCPNCGSYLDITNDMIGVPVQCEACRHIFTPDLKQELPRVAPPVTVRKRAERYTPPVTEVKVAEDDAYVPPELKPGTGFAIASLTVGICAIVIGVLFWFICCPFAQMPPAVIAIGLGYFGVRTEGRTMAIAGMICGVIAAILSVVPILAFGAFLSTVGGAAPPAPPPVAPPPATTTTPGMKSLPGKTPTTKW